MILRSLLNTNEGYLARASFLVATTSQAPTEAQTLVLHECMLYLFTTYTGLVCNRPVVVRMPCSAEAP